MSIWKPLRKFYIRTTNITHGFQDSETSRLISFYKLWAPFYDFSVKLDPAYQRELKYMIDSVVKTGDSTLDIGCGTGLGSVHAAKTASLVIAIDPSSEMITKMKKKISDLSINNIQIINGFFSAGIFQKKFNSIISSFALAHFSTEQRKIIYQLIFNLLDSNGRLGLFSAQGEIASTFETRDEIIRNLKSAGFQKFEINDVSDIYRISIANKS